MRRMTVVSLLLNVVVLIPIVTALLLNAGWIERAYGGPTPARGILLSVYLAIWVVSILLLFRRNSGMIGSLLIVQILYKLTTLPRHSTRSGAFRGTSDYVNFIDRMAGLNMLA